MVLDPPVNLNAFLHSDSEIKDLMLWQTDCKSFRVSFADTVSNQPLERIVERGASTVYYFPIVEEGKEHFHGRR